METLLLLAVPVVVSVLTQIVKSLKKIDLLPHRIAVIRFVAITFSFLGVAGVAIATDGEVDPTEIELYAEAIIAFIGTQLAYYFGKTK